MAALPLTRRIRLTAVVVAGAMVSFGVSTIANARDSAMTASPEVALQARPSEKPKPVARPTPSLTPMPTAPPTAPPTASPPRPTPAATRTPTGAPTAAPSQASSAAAETPPAAGAIVIPGDDAAPGGPDASLPPSTDWAAVAPLAVAFLVVGAALVLVLGRRRFWRSAAASMEDGYGAAGGASSPTDVPEDDQAARDESVVPRWLRPSVQAERFAMSRDAPKHGPAAAPRPVRAPIVFLDPGEDLAERRMVRYDGVQLVDQPSEVFGRTQAETGIGDEVEILRVEDVWANVVTPSGVTGWLPTMALTEHVAEVAAEVPADDTPGEAAASGQVAEPVALETLLDAIVARRRLEAAAEAPKPPRARRARRPRSVENPG